MFVLNKHSIASSGDLTIGSFSLNEVFNKSGTPVFKKIVN